MRLSSLSAWVVALAFWPAAALASHCTPQDCTGDLDGDGTIELADLSDLLENFGCCSPAACYDAGADLDGNGCVGLEDLSALLANFGVVCVFQYPPPPANVEAEQIALEMLGPAGPLFASAETVARIAADLAAIRAFEPSLAGQTHSPEWAATDLLVSVNPSVPHDDFDCLNDFYQAEIVGFLPSLNLYTLRFPRMLNPEAMAVIYDQSPEVDYAEPNGFIGGQNFWTPTPRSGGVWQWNVDDGFMDCFDGCDCHRVFVFQTTEAGTVTLVSYDEFGAPWCPF